MRVSQFMSATAQPKRAAAAAAAAAAVAPGQSAVDNDTKMSDEAPTNTPAATPRHSKEELDKLKAELQGVLFKAPMEFARAVSNCHTRKVELALRQWPETQFPGPSLMPIIDAVIRSSVLLYLETRVVSAQTFANRKTLRKPGLALRKAYMVRLKSVVEAAKHAKPQAGIDAMGRKILKRVDRKCVGARMDFAGYDAVTVKTDQEGAEIVKSEVRSRITGEDGSVFHTHTGVMEEKTADGTHHVTLTGSTALPDELEKEMRRLTLGEVSAEEKQEGEILHREYPFCAALDTTAYPNWYLELMEFFEPTAAQRRQGIVQRLIKAVPFKTHASFFAENQASKSPIKFDADDQGAAEFDAVVPQNVRWIDSTEFDRFVHPELTDMKKLFDDHSVRLKGTRSLADLPFMLFQLWNTMIPLLLWSTKMEELSIASRHMHMLTIGRCWYQLAWYHAECTRSKQCADPKQLFPIVVDATFTALQRENNPTRVPRPILSVAKEDENKDRAPILLLNPRVTQGHGHDNKEEPFFNSEQAKNFRIPLFRQMMEHDNVFAHAASSTDGMTCVQAALYRVVRAIHTAAIPAFCRSLIHTDRPIIAYSEFDEVLTSPSDSQLDLHPRYGDLFMSWILASGTTIAHYDHMSQPVMDKPKPNGTAAAVASASASATASTKPKKAIRRLPHSRTVKQRKLWGALHRAHLEHSLMPLLIDVLTPFTPSDQGEELETMCELTSAYLLGDITDEKGHISNETYGAEWLSKHELEKWALSHTGQLDGYSAEVNNQDRGDPVVLKHITDNITNLIADTAHHNARYQAKVGVVMQENEHELSVHATTAEAASLISEVQRFMGSNVNNGPFRFTRSRTKAAAAPAPAPAAAAAAAAAGTTMEDDAPASAPAPAPAAGAGAARRSKRKAK